MTKQEAHKKPDNGPDKFDESRKEEQQNNEKSVRFQFHEYRGLSRREQMGQNPASIQRWDGNRVKNGQDDVDPDAHP